MEIEPFDLLRATEVDARARHELFVCVKGEIDPGDPIPPLNHLVAQATHPAPYQFRREWVARHDGQLIGWARLEWMDTAANRDHAKVRIEVPPPLRRRGLGSRLLDAAVHGARAESRTLLRFTTADGTDAEHFLSARGAEKRQPFRISHLQIAGVDRGLLTRWVDRARERASGYTIVGWDDPCPPEHLEHFTEVIHVMNTAPADDLEQDDDVWTADDVRGWQAALDRQGYLNRVLCARDDTTGRFVGYTEMGFWPWAPERGFQGDTGVDPAHRNRGLGRWLKAAMLLRVLDEQPNVEVVETGNASSNDAMLSINVAMGFRPARHGGFWQLDLRG